MKKQPETLMENGSIKEQQQLIKNLLQEDSDVQLSKVLKEFQEKVLEVDISMADLQQHNIQPEHLKEVKTSQDFMDISKEEDMVDFDNTTPVVQDIEKQLISHHIDLEPVKERNIGKPRLDLGSFGHQLWETIKDQVAGYAVQARKNGRVIHYGQWNWARRPQNGGIGWGQDKKMHVASVSKLITAMAMVRLLQSRGISMDSSIAPHLPSYWRVGSRVNQITFRRLLTHRSGFREKDTDFWSMRQAVAQGVSATNINKSAYRNMNFGLCRILIAIISGKVSRDLYDSNASPIATKPTWYDTWWDLFSVSAYETYVKNEVFKPAGVYGASLNPTRYFGVLAYDYRGKVSGWDSGNKRAVSGGAGWHLSLNDLLKVMHEYRRGGDIVSSSTASTALNAGFGIDARRYTRGGYWWEKGGLWHTISGNGTDRTEQCMAYFLPDNTELAIFVNSQIGANAKSLRSTVRSLLLKNFK